MLSFGEANGLTSAYACLPDTERNSARCTVRWRQGTGAWTEATDTTFPLDFTLLARGREPLEWQGEVFLQDGRIDRSPAGRLLMRQD